MKRFFALFVTLVCILSVAMAVAKVDTRDKKSKVDVVKLNNKVSIMVQPPMGYKWNDEFPATLKFSVCSDVECLFVTEKIKIKKD
jgi:hypothetical protein